MSAVPVFRPVTTPLLSTVAMSVFSDSQVTSAEEPAGSNAAVRVIVWNSATSFAPEMLMFVAADAGASVTSMVQVSVDWYQELELS